MEKEGSSSDHSPPPLECLLKWTDGKRTSFGIQSGWAPKWPNEKASLGAKVKRSGLCHYTSAPLKWTDETRENIATYFNKNYWTFKTLRQKGRKKMDFLRAMRAELKLDCTDLQMKNVFDKMIHKYQKAREKLNADGIRNLSDANSMAKRMVIRDCPYFEILDEVMGNRIAPPCTSSNSSFETTGDSVDFPNLIVEEDATGLGLSPGHLHMHEDACAAGDNDAETDCMIEKTKAASGLERKDGISDDVLSAWVEAKRLKLETDKFMHSKLLDRMQLELEHRRLDAATDDKLLERQFELERIKVMGDIEIRKLQLQVELEKLRLQRKQSVL